MEIFIKIGKKELIIFLVFALIAIGIGLGTWLGIKRYREWEPGPIEIIVLDSEDLGDSKKIIFEIIRAPESVLIKVNCSPLAVFTVNPPLPINVTWEFSYFALEGNFEIGIRYTFEFLFETEYGDLITFTLKHKP